MNPTLHDAVTLRHFAAAMRLDILEQLNGHHPEPRWTEAVSDEIGAAARFEPHCVAIQQSTWLGSPFVAGVSDATAIYHLQIGLNDGVSPATKHRGEAESIYFAEKLGGCFATDDEAAFAYAKQRPALGDGRVFDSIYLLRRAVANDEITADEAAQIADQVEAQDRFFRKVHRVRNGRDYFI